jgi:hypothetical protein
LEMKDPQDPKFLECLHAIHAMSLETEDVDLMGCKPAGPTSSRAEAYRKS